LSKNTVTVTSPLKLLMVQVCPTVVVQPDQPANVEPELGVAVRVTPTPVLKFALHVVGHVMPAGTLLTDPDPVLSGPKSTVRVEVVVGQTTVAVIVPITAAPDEEMFPLLVFVVTVAVISELPHAWPVAAITPAELTVTICGVLEAQTTSSVMFFVTGGWMYEPTAWS
jgi:hypothetical protein